VSDIFVALIYRKICYATRIRIKVFLKRFTNLEAPKEGTKNIKPESGDVE
jgi:hypothetical protein